MSVKDPFSSKTVESKPLRVVMEVVKTKKIVNSFTKTMRRFDMDWNMLGEGTSIRDKIWAEVTLCLGKLCKCWERKFWIRCIFHYLHTQTLQEAGWSLWRSECLHVLSHSRKYFRAAESYRGLKPSRHHLDQKKPHQWLGEDLLLSSVAFMLMAPADFCFAYRRWVKGEILNLCHTADEEILYIPSDTNHLFKQFTILTPQNFLSIKSAFDCTFPKRVATACWVTLGSCPLSKRDMSETRKGRRQGRHAYKPCDMR